MKILQKTFVVYVLLAIVPILIAAFVASSVMKSALRNQSSAQLSATVASRSAAINGWAERQRQQMTIIAQQSLLTSNLQAFLKTGAEVRQQYLNQLLQEIVTNVEDYDALTLLSPEGRVAASTNKMILGADYSSQSFVAGHSPWAVEPFVDQGRLKIYLSKAIMVKGKRVATMLAIARGDAILQLMRDDGGLGQGGDIVLVQDDGHDGVLFVTPARGMKGDEPLRRLAEPQQVSPAMRAALQGKEQVLPFSRDFTGTEVIAATGSVPDIGWGLVAKKSTAQVFAPVSQLWLYLNIVLVLCALVALALAYWQARQLTAMVREMITVTGHIGQGELDQHVSIRGQDEFAELAKALNSMINRLRRADWQQSMELGELDMEVQQRRRQEAKLSGHQKIADLAMKVAHLGIWQVALAEQKIFLSTIMRQICGIKAADLDLDDFFSLVSKDERDRLRAFFEEAERGEAGTLSFLLTREDGTTVKVKILAVVPLKDKENKVVRLLGVSQEGSVAADD